MDSSSALARSDSTWSSNSQSWSGPPPTRTRGASSRRSSASAASTAWSKRSSPRPGASSTATSTARPSAATSSGTGVVTGSATSATPGMARSRSAVARRLAATAGSRGSMPSATAAIDSPPGSRASRRASARADSVPATSPTSGSRRSKTPLPSAIPAANRTTQAAATSRRWRRLKRAMRASMEELLRVGVRAPPTLRTRPRPGIARPAQPPLPLAGEGPAPAWSSGGSRRAQRRSIQADGGWPRPSAWPGSVRPSTAKPRRPRTRSAWRERSPTGT